MSTIFYSYISFRSPKGLREAVWLAMGKAEKRKKLKIYLVGFVAVSLLFVPISDRTQRIAAAAAALAAATAAAAEAGASRPGTYPEAE